MIYERFRKSVNVIAGYTPNKQIPVFGEKITKGRVKENAWAEIYLLARFIFALSLATLFSSHMWLVFVIVVIQIPSFIYLLKIIFPEGQRKLQDPGRSLFFAFGHYLEIGFSMAYIYRGWGVFKVVGLDVNGLTPVDSIYFSFVTMTTLGYGDISPVDDISKMLVISHTIIGLFMFAIVIGLFLSLASNEKEEKVSKSNEDFRKELRKLLQKADELGFTAVEINSGNLHRRVGGYPGQNHRMPICCRVMQSEMKAEDQIISQPDSGKGASLIIRYKLPR